ncbi:MAG TPA: alpha-2-macroglobulin family protein [Patescibacteria group bacterium]|nr:alpha-2-macroglobulin family protein [Patescibacteria group bacterium]
MPGENETVYHNSSFPVDTPTDSSETAKQVTSSVPPPPEHIPPPKNLFSCHVCQRLLSVVKGYWRDLPKKQRLLLVGLIVFLLSAISLLVLLTNPNIFEGQIIRPFEVPITEYGDWKRLEIPQREKPFFAMSATSQSKFGILPKETFILTADQPIQEEFLQQNLKTSTPVTVKKVSSQQYTITPKIVFALNQAFWANLDVEDKESDGHTFDRDYSWAYQAQGKFRIVNSIPGDKATDVPVNTGIEIVFSQDDYNDPIPFLTITPSVKYHVERHNETFAIVPLDPLAEKTVYTVTVRKGLNLSSRSDPIDTDFTFTFQTKEKEQKKSYFSLDEDFQQVSPDEPLITKVYTAEWPNEKKIQTEVYQFPSSTAFINSRKNIDEIQSSWMHYYAEESIVATTTLSRVMSVELNVQNKENLNFLQLPEKLPEGFYLVQFWSDNKQDLKQLWVQSTSLTGYVSVGKEQTVVWANMLDGTPASTAKVKVLGRGEEYTTNEKGFVTFSSPSVLFGDTRHYLEIVNPEQKRLVLPVNSLSSDTPPGKKTSDEYWAYLYHERYVYTPNDTVYFYGVVKRRDTNRPPSKVEVKLDITGSAENAEKFSRTITPDNDGSFIGSFKLENVPPDWGSIRLMVGDLEVASDGLSIAEYEKPEIQIEVTTDKKAIFSTEKVDFSAQAQFFDETPASHIPMKIYESRTERSTEIDTGENGEIPYTYLPQYKEPEYDSWWDSYPRYETVTFAPAIAQQKIIEGQGSVYVFGSKLMLTTETEQKKNKATVKGTVNHLDLTGLNEGTSSETKGKPSANTPVKLSTKKTWYEKKESGTYYDFIEKTTRKSYEYVKHEEDVEQKTLKTNENGEFSHEYTLEEGKSYTTSLVVTDSDNHPDKETVYFYYQTGSQNYEEFSKAIPTLTLDKETSEYSLGEEVKLRINLGEQIYPDTDNNRFLFLIAKQGQQEVTINDQPTFQFTFEKKHIPNISVAALIFTGKHYLSVNTPCRWSWYCSYYYYYNEQYYFNSLELQYKEDDSKLDISIKTDLQTYKPQDRAKVTVDVSKGTAPIQGASVHIVVVDQALAAMGYVIEPNILSDLYQSVPNYVYYNYYSHRPALPDENMAEQGGGGGDERELFKDTAYFGEAVTDANGEAHFEFTLPDNLTTWIIYAQGVTSELDAGQNESSLIVTKDFFVTSNFPKKYIQRDSPDLTGGSFGKSLKEKSSVDFTAIFLQGDTVKEKQTKTADAFRSVNFPFPQLDVGLYHASLKGKVQNLEDGIKLPFQVISSRFEFEHSTKQTLKKGQSLTSIGVETVLSDKPIKLIVSDVGKGLYYPSLARFCYTESNRLEKQLARLSASKILEKRFNDTLCTNRPLEITTFQNEDGGLSQVDWGSSNLETTVWAIFVDPSHFDKEKMKPYLREKLESSYSGTVDKIYAAWGLTMLGEPRINDLKILSTQIAPVVSIVQPDANLDTDAVMNQLEDFVSNQGMPTYKEQVLLALSLASIGETETAREIYYELLANYAYEYKPYIRIQSEELTENLNDQYVKDTGWALLLGSMVEKTYDEGLFSYLRDYREYADDIVLDLSDIAFIDEELSKLPDETTKVSFTSPSNKKLEKELTSGGNLTFSLNPSETNSFTLNVLSGKIDAASYYFVGPETLSLLPSDDRMKIKRSYKKVKGDGTDIHIGDVVEVRIDFDIHIKDSPPGTYTVTDHLPSGFTYLSNPSTYGLSHEGWTSQVTHSIVEHTFWNSPWWRIYGKRYVVYYARASFAGTYIAEPAVIQSRQELDLFKSTPEETIEIKGSNL